ncbi:MAG: helix-turn-helix transcriptional regulator [Chloroflexi bacterium]|nr:helix-turn-helix transcriptional regulator [Chloroflexota bacterium]
MRNLRHLRRMRFLTQRELAGKVGVSWQTISDWENGRNEPRVKHLKALCEALGVRPEELWAEPPDWGKAAAA